MTLIKRYLDLIKFEHTIFALPFALISLLVASGGRPSLSVLFWVLMAMVGARSAAMAFNRVADWKIDAANPRTADRHIPAGAISVAGAWMLVVLSAALLVLAAWMLNPLCFRLSPVALAVVLGYSYMKRVSSMAHLILGLGLAIAPVGAWLAVTGEFAAFP
jgi:4-hydroxybenzoate polyprenyltransferase